jgi:hypothetical protein
VLRLFVALALPAAIKTDLALLAGGIPGARWLPPELRARTLAVGLLEPAAIATLPPGAVAGVSLSGKLASNPFQDKRATVGFAIAMEPPVRLASTVDRSISSIVRAPDWKDAGSPLMVGPPFPPARVRRRILP